MSSEWLNQPDYLKELTLQSTSIIATIQSNQSTLVPSDFFELGCEEFVCETAFGKPTTDTYFLSEPISELNIYNVFQLPQKLFEVLIDLFPTAKINHQSTANLTAAKVIAPKNAEHYVALFCEAHIIHIVAFKNNTLYFSNQFEVQTSTDVLYFTLATIENLKLQGAPLVGFNVGVHPKFWEIINKYHPNCLMFTNEQLFDFNKNTIFQSTHFLNLLCA